MGNADNYHLKLLLSLSVVAVAVYSVGSFSSYMADKETVKNTHAIYEAAVPIAWTESY